MALKPLLLRAAKFAITGGLLWYVASRIDFAESLSRIARLDPGWGILALAVIALVFLLGCTRWFAFLRVLGVKADYRLSLRLYLISMFFGQTLPASVGGDAVRIWLIVQRGARVANAVSSVALDRLSGFAALTMITAVTLPGLMALVDDPTARATVVVLLIAAAGCFVGLIALSYLPNAMNRFALMARLAAAMATARRAGLSSRIAFSAVMLSFAVHLSSIVAIYLIARGLGLEPAFSDYLYLVPPVIFLTSLPISLAGWGVREGAMITALGFAGVGASDALAVSVLFGIGQLLISLIGAAFWLSEKRTARAKAERQANPGQVLGGGPT